MADSLLRCLSPCKLREYCQSPSNCAAWVPRSMPAFRTQCRNTHLGAAFLAAAIVIVVVALAALRLQHS